MEARFASHMPSKRQRRQAIPPLECDRGTAITDTQKANILADTLKENFTENTYQNRDTDNHINNTVNTFISTNPTTYLDPVLLDEIITYIKKSSSKKAPALAVLKLKLQQHRERSMRGRVTEMSRSMPRSSAYWPAAARPIAMIYYET
ncbi:hypothetical protein TNCV_4382461 [Trichonephila clavipes]|nr:hypothetical protein TNCV_4382461 [Trichonephila clavipes]